MAEEKVVKETVDVEAIVKENEHLKAQNQKLSTIVNRLYSMYSDLMSKYLEA